jgi:hypothetical protein
VINDMHDTRDIRYRGRIVKKRIRNRIRERNSIGERERLKFNPNLVGHNGKSVIQLRTCINETPNIS